MGDFNVINEEIDIHQLKGRENMAGCTQIERNNFKTLLNDCNLIDSFRYQHPKTKKYTFWSNRGHAKDRNKGWRLDYALINKNLIKSLKISNIVQIQTKSDHVPIMCGI